MKLFAKWTDDCQGKKDYDAPILVISTRYWPSGGGFDVYDSRTGRLETSADRTDIKPAAHCGLSIAFQGEDDEFADHHVLVEMDIEGDSFEDVKAKVEKFAQEQMDKAVKAIKEAFYVDPNGSPR